MAEEDKQRDLIAERDERFKNRAAAWQSIVVIIAIIVGGGWTLYRYWTLGEREKAIAELEKEKNALATQATVDIDVRAQQEHPVGSSGYFVGAMVHIANKGTRNVSLEFNSNGNGPLQVTYLDFGEDGTSSRVTEIVQKNLIADSLVLRMGGAVDYPFLVKVPKKGLYLVSFQVKLSPKELTVHQESGGVAGDEIYWPGNAYVVVN